jgi:hypothetical protein
MKRRQCKRVRASRQDKQLQGITLGLAIEKRRLGQALNAKEFAVCAGISYSTALSWFRLPGFPLFHGVVFWEDFAQWRASQNGLSMPSSTPCNNEPVDIISTLPPRAARILIDAGTKRS